MAGMEFFLRIIAIQIQLSRNTLSNNQYCLIIGDSCQDVDIANNGNCQTYSFQENPPPPPPNNNGDDNDNDNNGEQDTTSPLEQVPNFFIITIVGFSMVLGILSSIIILLKYLSSR